MQKSKTPGIHHGCVSAVRGTEQGAPPGKRFAHNGFVNHGYPAGAPIADVAVENDQDGPASRQRP
jgi:hypothetical protein